MAHYDSKVTIRFSKRDRNKLMKEANNRRLSLSSFIRTTLLQNTDGEDQQ